MAIRKVIRTKEELLIRVTKAVATALSDNEEISYFDIEAAVSDGIGIATGESLYCDIHK